MKPHNASKGIVPTGDPPENRAAEQRKHRRDHRGNGEVADWSAVDAGLLRAAIAAVTKHGYAFLCGYTRDKGAYTITFVGDEMAKPEYVRPNENIDLVLEGVAEDYG